ncbi:1-phosphofructokinase family hexose kinase [Nocardiopsis suaedae]|uniref:Hexose kinase n=1 Tax=Nocardiopsis suaedae TaxID=3018444 RepID=A0ABT4TNY1_9ACTN|nr:hexose kinase [Nocardiopsis suaedae]MDA2806392.1 hexose kinase [Nocardiopsis suaedae]
MITTVTANPSVDRTLEVDALVPGEVLRARGWATEPGGKGVNVSRALHRNGLGTTALLPLGGAPGRELAALLAEHGVPCERVDVAAPTRSNVTLTDAAGTTTKVNMPGAPLTPGETAALVDAAEALLAAGPRWLVAAGSLPAGAPDDLYALLARAAARYGVPVAVDTSGPALRAAVEGGGVDLLKPNEAELAELVGAELSTVGDAVAAARRALAPGNGAVLLTLGRHGALLVDQGGAAWAGGPALAPRSSVGAGDCALAGYLSSSGPPHERLAAAVAWGRAAAALPGSTVPGPGDLHPELVHVVPDPAPDLLIKEL